MVRLSVLMACLPQRRELARPLLDSLYRQATDEVEVLALTDNQRRTIGRKRNDLLSLAHGDYVTFVDDDDMISDDYVSSLLGALGPDVVTFDVSVTLNGGPPFPAHYSKDFDASRNLDRLWQRLPNHLMCTQRDLARQAGFPDITVGEDAAYAARLHPLLRTETRINRVLYHYRYRDDTTATQGG